LLIANHFRIAWSNIVAHGNREGRVGGKRCLQVDLGRRLVESDAAVVFDIG
jgi:hypothetical protein